MSTFVPIDSELALGFTASEPVESHFHGLEMFYTNVINSFIASMFDFMSALICLVCACVKLLIISSVISACSSIRFALNCLAVTFVCLFSFANSFEMKALMFAHVLSAAALFSHSRAAGLYSHVAFR